MIRRPPRSTQSRSSAASDVYKRQAQETSEVAATPEATPVEIEPVEPDHESLAAKLSEINPPTPSGADLLSRLLDDEESFEQTVVAAGAAAGVSVPAVSYTHLRAHETRHDLVC